MHIHYNCFFLQINNFYCIMDIFYYRYRPNPFFFKAADKIQFLFLALSLCIFRLFTSFQHDKAEMNFPVHISLHTSTLIFLDMFLKAKLLVKGYILRVCNFWFLFINFHLNRFYLIYTHNKLMSSPFTIPKLYLMCIINL